MRQQTPGPPILRDPASSRALDARARAPDPEGRAGAPCFPEEADFEEDPATLAVGLASVALGLFGYAWYRRHPVASLRPYGIEIRGPVRGAETILYVNLARWRLTRHWLILNTVDGQKRAVPLAGAPRELRRRIQALLPSEAEGGATLPRQHRTWVWVVGALALVTLASGR